MLSIPATISKVLLQPHQDVTSAFILSTHVLLLLASENNTCRGLSR